VYLVIPRDHVTIGPSEPDIKAEMFNVHVAPKLGLHRLQQTSTGMTMYIKPICHTDTEVPSYKGDIHCSVVTEASSLKIENVDVKAQWKKASDRRLTTADIFVDSYPVCFR
jgi:hypothetical protein